MSYDLVRAVWERKDLDASERLVMLSLADHADDQGYSYPSIKRLCERTSLAERTVQGAIKRLVGRGLLSVRYGEGRNGTNAFVINAAPAADAPPQDLHPAANAPRSKCATPPQILHLPPAADAPKPTRTTIEPSNSNEAREVAELLEIYASPSAVASFMAYRRRSKAKGTTLTAAKRLASNLRAIVERGGDADDALGLAEERVWLTVEPDWYFRAKGNSNGNRQDFAANPSGVHSDPALRAIFAAAGAFKA